MEYRETPRIAATEGRLDGVIDHPDPRPRLRRFELIRAHRQLDQPRVVAAVLLSLAGLGVLGYAGTQAVRLAVHWLHQQPQYQLRFQDIKLAEPPPAWFRGGAEAFLKQVRDNVREAEILPVMELKPDRIEHDFKLFRWVDAVRRVEFPPQGITVHLDYKQPVAMIPIPAGDQAILDRSGHLLPPEDIDTEKLGPLIKITGRGLAPAAENRPGKVWKSSAPGARGRPTGTLRSGAARLAAFLLEPVRANEAASVPGLRVLSIVATDRRGFFVQTAEDAMIQWGESPGEETNGSLDAEEKWEILMKWAKSASRRSLPEGDYWAFSRSELKPVETRRDR